MWSCMPRSLGNLSFGGLDSREVPVARQVCKSWRAFQAAWSRASTPDLCFALLPVVEHLWVKGYCVALVRECSALRSVDMEGWWNSATAIEQVRNALNGKQIQSLQIGGAYRIHDSRKEELLRSLRSLGVLQLSIDYSSSAEVAQVLAACPMLHTLIVCCQTDRSFSFLPDLGSVRSLKFRYSTPILISARFPALEEFEATVFDAVGLEMFLQHNPQLQYVRATTLLSDTLGQQICSMKATRFDLTVRRGPLTALSDATSIHHLTLGMNFDLQIVSSFLNLADLKFLVQTWQAGVLEPLTGLPNLRSVEVGFEQRTGPVDLGWAKRCARLDHLIVLGDISLAAFTRKQILELPDGTATVVPTNTVVPNIKESAIYTILSHHLLDYGL